MRLTIQNSKDEKGPHGPIQQPLTENLLYIGVVLAAWETLINLMVMIHAF